MDACKLLAAHGARVMDRDSRGYSYALFRALLCLSATDLFVIGFPDFLLFSDFMSPSSCLHKAVSRGASGNEVVMDLFLNQEGADPNAADDLGYTPFMLAYVTPLGERESEEVERGRGQGEIASEIARERERSDGERERKRAYE